MLLQNKQKEETAMTFHLAIAGTLPEDPQLYRQIDELIGQLKAYLYPHQQNMGYVL